MVTFKLTLLLICLGLNAGIVYAGSNLPVRNCNKIGIDQCLVYADFSPRKDTVVTNSNPIIFSNQSVGAISCTWFLNGTFFSNSKDITVNFSPGVNELLLVATNGTCSDSAFSFIIRKENSGITAAVNVEKEIAIPGFAIEPFCVSNDIGNGYLVAGKKQQSLNNFDNNSRTTCLIKLDKNGCVEWARSGLEGLEVVQTILATRDSGFLVSSYPFHDQTLNYPDSLIIYKIDKLGTIQWAHGYSNGVSVTNYFSAVCETGDNGFVLELGSFPYGNKASFLTILKIDYSGKILWSQGLSIGGPVIYNVGGVVCKNGFIYATGSISETQPPYQVLQSFIMKIAEQTGQLFWTRQNDESRYALRFIDLHLFKESLLINSFDLQSKHSLIQVDYDGNLIAGYRINNPDQTTLGNQNIVVGPDNNIYFHQTTDLATGFVRDIIGRLNSNFQFIWQNDYYLADSKIEGWYHLASPSDNGIAAVGSAIGSEKLRTITFLKMDSEGSACNTGAAQLNVSSIQPLMTPFVWGNTQNFIFNASDLRKTFLPTTTQATLVCPKYADGCDLLKLESPRFLCNKGDAVSITAHGDPSCSNPLFWTFDSQNASVVSKNSSGLVLSFKREGVYVVKAAKRGCNFIADSVIISVGNHLGIVPLPADTLLCEGKNLILNAGSGYESYLWQDNTTEESITVSTPGIYWVKLENTNGCITTDTISIPAVISVPKYFLPVDTIVCSYQTITIAVRKQYDSYLWSTGEGGPSIKIKNQGSYILEVSDRGCMGADTILVDTKYCANRIVFPNAFTPNNDGHNDEFRAMTSGNLVKYQLSIFNRWGQKVFEAMDPLVGWRGTGKSTSESTSAFAWICVYQFEGEKEKLLSGNCMLIK